MVIFISKKSSFQKTLDVNRVVFINNISGHIYRFPVQPTESLVIEEAFKKSTLKVGLRCEHDGSNGSILIDNILRLILFMNPHVLSRLEATHLFVIHCLSKKYVSWYRSIQDTYTRT